MIKNYTGLITFPTLIERYRYLRMPGSVGDILYGADRYLNQRFYTSSSWARARDKVILRDEGCELGIESYPIIGPITVHHINRVTAEDILNDRDWLYDPEYLICVSPQMHKAIHFGDESLLPKGLIIRRPNDTCPWK